MYKTLEVKEEIIMFELIAGAILGGILFGGRSVTTTSSSSKKDTPIPQEAMPTFISFNKKTNQALYFCGSCFGTGMKPHHSGSICDYDGDHSSCRVICPTCKGTGKLVVDVGKNLWKKVKVLAKQK